RFFIYVFFFFFFFFFSSRRRHTRSKRDWSSDVCSSDLIDDSLIRYILHEPIPDQRIIDAMSDLCSDSEPMIADVSAFLFWTGTRSEERRVGKECRYRWGR